MLKNLISKWQGIDFSVNSFNGNHVIGKYINKSHLKARVSIGEVEAQELVSISLEGSDLPVSRPFGWRYSEWVEFKAMSNNDNIWRFEIVIKDSDFWISCWTGYVEKKMFSFGSIIISELVEKNINEQNIYNCNHILNPEGSNDDL